MVEPGSNLFKQCYMKLLCEKQLMKTEKQMHVVFHFQMLKTVLKGFSYVGNLNIWLWVLGGESKRLKKSDKAGVGQVPLWGLSHRGRDVKLSPAPMDRGQLISILWPSTVHICTSTTVQCKKCGPRISRAQQLLQKRRPVHSRYVVTWSHTQTPFMRLRPQRTGHHGVGWLFLDEIPTTDWMLASLSWKRYVLWSSCLNGVDDASEFHASVRVRTCFNNMTLRWDMFQWFGAGVWSLGLDIFNDFCD